MSVELLNKLLLMGVSKRSPKRDLIRIFKALRSLEDRARLAYESILSNNADELSLVMKKVITGIMSDEVKHVKIVDQLIGIIESYNLELDINEYYLPRSDER